MGRVSALGKRTPRGAVSYTPQQTAAPNPFATLSWLDASTTPPTLKTWNGSAWAAVGGGGAAPTMIATTAPTISGSPTVGQTLLVSNGAWSAAPDTYTYQWKRAGVAITGATFAGYVPVTADIGQVTCTVTALKNGYQSTPVTTSAVTVAAPATLVTNGLIADLDASKGITATSGTISAWTDQSGAGNDAAQATTAYQPFARTDYKGRPVVRFRGSGTGTTRFMTFASAATISLSQHSVFVVYGAQSTRSQILLRTGASANWNLLATGTNQCLTFSGRELTSAKWVTQPYAWGYTTTGAVGGTRAFGSTFGPTVTAAPFALSASGTGLNLGGNTGGNTALGDMYRVLVYSRVLTDAEAAQVVAFLNSTYSLRTAPYTRQLLVEGDSIFDAGGSANLDGYNPATAALSDSISNWSISNTASSGATVSIATGRAAATDAALVPGIRNVLLVTLGRNDMGTAGGNLTAAQHYANMSTYVQARVAAGWEVWVGTVIAGASNTVTNDAAYNAMLKGSAAGGTGNGIIFDAGASKVVDFRALAAFSNASDTTYYQPDQTHPTNPAGVDALGGLVRSTLAAA